MSDHENKLHVSFDEKCNSRTVALQLLKDVGLMVEQGKCSSFAIEWDGKEVTFGIGGTPQAQ